jgi:benzoate transport
VTRDPTVVVANEPMHFRQTLAVAIVVICVAIDGFDVFAIAFASPVIAEQWNIDAAALGVVLSTELIGMGVGAYALGSMADRFGRRTIVIASLVITATGMWLGSVASGVTVLGLARLYTGLGIGGLLAAGSAIVFESANDRRRDMAVALMVAGYPLGAAAGGIVAATILGASDRWQTIFEVGAIATAALIIPVALYVPETIAFLCDRQPREALQRVNRVLLQYGRAPAAAIPPTAPAGTGGRLLRLFDRDTAAVTLALTAAFFMHMMTFYFLMKWIPKLVVDLGHSVAAASMVLVLANATGAAGSLAMSLLTLRYPVQRPVIVAMVCGSLAVLAFGQGVESLFSLSVVAAIAGFFTTGATAGFYALMAQSFPARLRASGAGFVIGVGRAGAAAGPVAAGLLFAAAWPLSWVAAVLACGCLLAAITIGRMTAR